MIKDFYPKHFIEDYTLDNLKLKVDNHVSFLLDSKIQIHYFPSIIITKIKNVIL